MLREDWEVRENLGVWIPHHEEVCLIGIWRNTTDDLGIGVLELPVSSELLSLLLIGV